MKCHSIVSNEILLNFLFLSEPQVCFNAVNPRNGTYGYFICPEEGQPDSYDYCCGEEGEQRCCGFFDEYCIRIFKSGCVWGQQVCLTQLHSERPKLYTILVFLSAVGLTNCTKSRGKCVVYAFPSICLSICTIKWIDRLLNFSLIAMCFKLDFSIVTYKAKMSCVARLLQWGLELLYFTVRQFMHASIHLLTFLILVTLILLCLYF